MAYKKSIKGDNNQASEQFAHNRIEINMGASGVILVLFAVLLICAAVGWMMLKFGSLLAVLIVGSFVALFVGAGVAGIFLLAGFGSDIMTKIKANRLLSNTVHNGEVMAYWNGEDWDHLSAEHVRAGIPQLPMKAESIIKPDHTEAILELYDKGISYRSIEKALAERGVTYYEVQKTVNEFRKAE